MQDVAQKPATEMSPNACRAAPQAGALRVLFPNANIRLHSGRDWNRVLTTELSEAVFYIIAMSSRIGHSLKILLGPATYLEPRRTLTVPRGLPRFHSGDLPISYTQFTSSIDRMSRRR